MDIKYKVYVASLYLKVDDLKLSRTEYRGSI